jgi:hypothetical protein
MLLLTVAECHVAVAIIDASVCHDHASLNCATVSVMMLLDVVVLASVATRTHAYVCVCLSQNAPVNAPVTFDILSRDKYGNSRALDDILWITVETSERVDITNVTWSYVRADTYAVSYIPLTLGKVKARALAGYGC